MKTIKSIFTDKIFLTCLLALLIALGFSSCYAPSPLYGTWADNTGDRITFMTDGSYSAKINLSGADVGSTGTYEVLMNILVFTDDGGSTTETEWDLRGNILYLTWYDGNTNKLLMLYKIKN